MNTNNQLLLTEFNIHDCVTRLQYEFSYQNITISLNQVQNIFSRTIGFNNWDELYKVIKKESEMMEFAVSFNKLSEIGKKNLIDNFIELEDLKNLNTFIRYKFDPAIFNDSTQSEMISLLKNLNLKSKNQWFQENVLTAINHYLTIDNSNAEQIISVVCNLNISAALLDEVIKKYPFTKYHLQVGLIIACESNNIQNTESLLLNYPIVDIDDVFFLQNCKILFNPLCCAIRTNSIETVKFLLTSPTLRKTANINIHNSEPLFVACTTGHFELVQYLLCDNDLTLKADMYSEHCRCLITAYGKERLDIVHFLLYDMKIKLTNNFYEKIENKSDYMFFEDSATARNLTKEIEKRDLYLRLNQTLIPKKHSSSDRMKI